MNTRSVVVAEFENGIQPATVGPVDPQPSQTGTVQRAPEAEIHFCVVPRRRPEKFLTLENSARP